MKKIMFNDKYGLTQAVLDGRKTMTRRIVPQSTLQMAEMECRVCGGSLEERIKEHSYFVFNEVVAVAESYKDIHKIYFSKFEIERQRESAGWTNKLFVKAELMPHHIRITDINIERLQDIRWTDCFKEGIKRTYGEYTFWAFDKEVKPIFPYPQEAFRYMIDKISGKGTWNSNPYVFVYEFELLDFLKLHNS